MRDYLNILYVDTAVDACCVGVMVDGARVFEEVEVMSRGQADAALPMVRRVMAAAGLEFEDLDAVVTSVGPGTFTGLRAGLSVAQSFALALDIPIYGVTSLQAAALSAVVDGDEVGVLVLVESRREEFYVQGFGGGLDLHFGNPSLIRGDDVFAVLQGLDCRHVMVGNGLVRFKEHFDMAKYCGMQDDVLFGQPEDVLEAFRGGEACFMSDVSPIYLRDADVSVPKTSMRVLAQS